MKKILLLYPNFLYINLAALLVLLFLKYKEFISPELFSIGALVILILITLSALIASILCASNYFLIGYKRLRFCDDPLFDELNKYFNHCGETNEHYQNLINAIHFFYKEGGRVDTEVGNNLKRLYKRRDFLYAQLHTKEYFTTCLTSVGLSIFASLFITFIVEYSDKQVLLLFTLPLFFAVLLLNSYISIAGESNRVDEYELNLLNAKIVQAENDIIIEYKREEFLLTKQAVINCLIKKCNRLHWKRTEKIEADIHLVEKLNLNLDNSNYFKEVSFFLGKKQERGVLFLDNDNHLAYDQYQKLYEVLIKYDLIPELPEPKKTK